MLKSEFSPSVPSRSHTSIPNSSTAHATEQSVSDPRLQLYSKPSLWKLPGLDSDTFYAAALYLHAATGGLETKSWPRGPETPEVMRNFLDRLADCFARSKKEDARDHVSATAMARNAQQKTIKLYIAKNQSYKESESSRSQEMQDEVANENDQFAKKLVAWFTELADAGAVHNEIQDHWSMFEKMCDFSRSRLEYYIEGISKFNTDDLERVVLVNLNEKFQKGWKEVKIVVEKCKRYQDSKAEGTPASPNSISPESVAIRSFSPELEANQTEIAICAKLAGKIRKTSDFLDLSDEIETSISKSKFDDLSKLLKWVNYLGRLHAAYVGFWEFCKGEEQRGFSFSFELLPSKEVEWAGPTYLERIQSWTGDLHLTDELIVKKFVDGQVVSQCETIQERLCNIIEIGKTARVHCEMQLLMHFLRQETKDVMDYFGCSKKSCWLCWQIMSQNAKFSIKDTHRKLYPLWAFPFEFSPSQPAIAEGLRSAYHDMLYLIQNMVIMQTALSSVKPYLQSSARLSPFFRRDRVTDSIGPALTLGDRSMSVQYEAFPIVEVPVLQLPASSQALRGGQVWAYEMNTLRIWQTLLQYEYHDDRNILLAFQLITKPDHLRSTSGVDEFQQVYWSCATVPRKVDKSKRAKSDKLDHWYNIYYRSARDSLKPNPYVARVWEEIHQLVPETFPWRGDVFITCTENDPFQPRTTRTFSEVDESGFLIDLKRYFRSCRADHAKKLWAAEEENATRIMEQYKSTLQNASKQPDPSKIGPHYIH